MSRVGRAKGQMLEVRPGKVASDTATLECRIDKKGELQRPKGMESKRLWADL